MIAKLDYLIPRAFIGFALLFALWLAFTVSYGEGVQWGQAHPIPRYVSLGELGTKILWKDPDTNCWRQAALRGAFMEDAIQARWTEVML